jgi:hypothetical protein
MKKRVTNQLDLFTSTEIIKAAKPVENKPVLTVVKPVGVNISRLENKEIKGHQNTKKLSLKVRVQSFAMNDFFLDRAKHKEQIEKTLWLHGEDLPLSWGFQFKSLSLDRDNVYYSFKVNESFEFKGTIDLVYNIETNTYGAMFMRGKNLIHAFTNVKPYKLALKIHKYIELPDNDLINYRKKVVEYVLGEGT